MLCIWGDQCTGLRFILICHFRGIKNLKLYFVSYKEFWAFPSKIKKWIEGRKTTSFIFINLEQFLSWELTWCGVHRPYFARPCLHECTKGVFKQLNEVPGLQLLRNKTHDVCIPFCSEYQTPPSSDSTVCICKNLQIDLDKFVWVTK